MAFRIIEVCTGRSRPIEVGGRRIASAIVKTPRDGPVAVGPLGLEGDEQADPAVHGGRTKAVYAYPSEHLAFWQTVRAQARAADWNAPLPHGAIGNNLLLAGLREDDLWIADRLRVVGRDGAPGCVLAVSEPRRPCAKFAAMMGFAQAGKLMAQSGFCGAYLAVIEPGTVAAGDTVELEPGPREVGIRELFRARTRG